MKRVGNLFDKICNIENIRIADKNARKGKSKIKKHIRRHDRNAEKENNRLLNLLKSGKYKTSKYINQVIYEPKRRVISKLPYYPDRIAQHAIMNVLKPIFISWFIKYTYANIQGRGIHSCLKDVQTVLRKHPEETKYCLKLDIKKYYPNINHDILKHVLANKIKDNKCLDLLYGIIDSFRNDSEDKYGEGATGLPLGNFTSGYFANIYLMYFDRWCKDILKCKYYFRYADDIVILSDNKEFLANVYLKIKQYLNENLNLILKQNYQIFPIDSRGLDFVGYVLYHNNTRLRKSIKKRVVKLVRKRDKNSISAFRFLSSFPSYFGWFKHCKSFHLLLKIARSHQELNRFVT